MDFKALHFGRAATRKQSIDGIGIVDLMYPDRISKRRQKICAFNFQINIKEDKF